MIGVVGAGAFGTALAISLARAGQSVTLWGRSPADMTTLAQTRCNSRHLPGISLPEGIRPTSDLEDLRAADCVLLAIPMQSLRGFLDEHRAMLDGKALVACCKGMDLATLKGPTALLTEACPNAVAAILTGPSFAHDIARGLPTALTLACSDRAAEALQTRLSTGNLRLYRTDDCLGAEIGGALKNVVAIAAGVTIGAGLGDSARAALITRGYAEMVRLAVACGARAETLGGLSGLGDLVLTCTSAQSRNFRYGLSIGQDQAFDPHVTVEGAATSLAAVQLGAAMNVDLPLTQTVANLISGKSTLTVAISDLLSRPLKQE